MTEFHERINRLRDDLTFHFPSLQLLLRNTSHLGLSKRKHTQQQ